MPADPAAHPQNAREARAQGKAWVDITIRPADGSKVSLKGAMTDEQALAIWKEVMRHA